MQLVVRVLRMIHLRSTLDSGWKVWIFSLLQFQLTAEPTRQTSRLFQFPRAGNLHNSPKISLLSQMLTQRKLPSPSFTTSEITVLVKIEKLRPKKCIQWKIFAYILNEIHREIHVNIIIQHEALLQSSRFLKPLIWYKLTDKNHVSYYMPVPKL